MVLRTTMAENNTWLRRWRRGFFLLVITSLLLLFFHFRHQSMETLFGGKAIQLIQNANTVGLLTLNLQNNMVPLQIFRPNRDKSVSEQSSEGNLGSTETDEETDYFDDHDIKSPIFTSDQGNAGIDEIDVEDSFGSVEDYGVFDDHDADDDYRECDIYNGRWVRDQTKPLYPPGSCPHIDKDFDCHFNGRPDEDYLRWRWKPNDCDLPSFNATDFLERLRGQRLVFVGDSLNRNMWESMVCMLRNGVRDKKKVYEITGKKEFKKKGFYAFKFEDYDCTVDFVATTFLVKESSLKTKNGSMDTLRLDLIDDATAAMYQNADIIVFNTGHWWTHEKTSKGENYYQEGNYVYPKLNVDDAYKRALTTWASWMDNNIDTTKTQVFFRGYSLTHFRGGQWNSGGKCHDETEPISDDSFLQNYPSKMTILEQVLDQMKNTHVMFMNVSKLTDYRKDAHPSIYRKHYKTEAEKLYAAKSQDCSHWCLPGVPDAWNELLYASLLRRGQGSWRKQSSLY